MTPVPRSITHLRTPSARAARAVGALAVVAAALVGCTPAPAPTVFVTAAPEPAETIIVTATPTPPPVVVEGSETGPIPIEPNAPAPEIVEGPAYDLGARPGAQGATTSDGAGGLANYTVVAGDSFFDIAQRFEVPQQQLLRMNPSVPDFGETVYIGQVINLDWTKTL